MYSLKNDYFLHVIKENTLREKMSNSYPVMASIIRHLSRQDRGCIVNKYVYILNIMRKKITHEFYKQSVTRGDAYIRLT